MARFCPSCGTEVDDTALFCPTCGQAIDAAVESEAPVSGIWPDPPNPEAAPAPPAAPMGSPYATATGPSSAAGAADAPRTAAARRRPQVDLPLTLPVTLSGWLVGVGVTLASLGVLIGLFDGMFNAIDIVLLPALLAVTATVFLATAVPAVPRLRLSTMAVALVGFGVGVDRIGFGGWGLGELLLFVGSAAASIGVLMSELGLDQPLRGRGG